jgi:WD40 repeat protein
MPASVAYAPPVRPSTAAPYVIRAVFSPDNKYILAIYLALGGRAWNDQWATLLDAATGKELRRMFESGEVPPFAFLPDGKHLLAPDNSAAAEAILMMWEIPSGKPVRPFGGKEKRCSCLAVSPDGKLATSVHHPDGHVVVWDVSTGKRVRGFNAFFPVYSLFFSPDGRQVYASSPITLRVWDVATGKPIPRSYSEYEKKSNQSHCIMSQSPDGRFACSGCFGYDRAQPMLKVWDLKNGKMVGSFTGHSKDYYVMSATFTADGNHVVSASWDGSLREWEVATGKELWRADLGKGWVESVAFSADRSRALVGEQNGTIRLWNLVKHELLWERKPQW